jgi:tRNA uridine 5-carboxymethylaminomethyl modification enzyme
LHLRRSITFLAVNIDPGRFNSIRIAAQPILFEAILLRDNIKIVLKQSVTLEELLRRPRVPYTVIEQMAPAADGFAHALELETDIKYAGYIQRQRNHVAQTEKFDGLKLPAEMNYLGMVNLSKEAREKLNKIRPETLGQASRIGGVSPADVSVLLVWLETARRTEKYAAIKEAKEQDCAASEAGLQEGAANEARHHEEASPAVH